MFLEGKLVYLRALERDDIGDDYHNWVNDEAIMKYLDSPFPLTMDNLYSYYDSMRDSKDYVFFAIIDKQTEKHVGNAKIGPINWIHRRTGFGRIIGKEYWSNGFGKEVVKLLVRYIFDQLNLDRVIEHNISDNIKAVESNVKAGLDNEGKIKSYVYADGEYKDVVIVGLTRERYLEKKKSGMFNCI